MFPVVSIFDLIKTGLNLFWRPIDKTLNSLSHCILNQGHLLTPSYLPKHSHLHSGWQQREWNVGDEWESLYISMVQSLLEGTMCEWMLGKGLHKFRPILLISFPRFSTKSWSRTARKGPVKSKGPDKPCTDKWLSSNSGVYFKGQINA